MYGFGLDISENNSYSEWSISNEEDIIIYSGTTGSMPWNLATYETGFELFDGYFFHDLVVTGYRSGNSNPYDNENAQLEGFPIPEPATVFLICCGVVVLIRFRRRFRKA